MIVMFVFNVMASIRIFMRKWIHSLKGHHDQDSQGEKKWSTQVRHNKDLFTNAATPIFCIFLCIGIYVTSKNAMEFSVGNWGKISFETTLKLLSFQNHFYFSDQKQLDTSLFYCNQLFIHMIVTPGVFYVFSAGARKHVLQILGFRSSKTTVYDPNLQMTVRNCNPGWYHASYTHSLPSLFTAFRKEKQSTKDIM